MTPPSLCVPDDFSGNIPRWFISALSPAAPFRGSTDTCGSKSVCSFHRSICAAYGLPEKAFIVVAPDFKFSFSGCFFFFFLHHFEHWGLRQQADVVMLAGSSRLKVEAVFSSSGMMRNRSKTPDILCTRKEAMKI